MNPAGFDDLGNLSMLELFRVEADNQTGLLTGGLLALEKGNAGAGEFETLMRAAHSLKGAARIINLQAAVEVAHAMEDCFVAAQHGRLKLGTVEVDVLLKCVDFLARLCKTAGPGAVLSPEQQAETVRLVAALHKIHSAASGPSTPATRAASEPKAEPPSPAPSGTQTANAPVSPDKAQGSDRVVRLTAENLNRLLGLAGESLVESRWLRPFGESLQRLKRQQVRLSEQLDSLRQSLESEHLSERSEAQLHSLIGKLGISHEVLKFNPLTARTCNAHHHAT